MEQIAPDRGVTLPPATTRRRRFAATIAGGRDSVRRVVRLSSILVLLFSFPALVVMAALPNLTAFAIVLLLSHGAERYAFRHAPNVVSVLGRIHLTITFRLLLRDAALILLLARANHYPTALVIVAALAILSLHVLRGVLFLLRDRIAARRKVPVLTRNVDLARLRIPDPPPWLLMRGRTRRWLYFTVPVACGVLLDLAASTLHFALVGAGVALGAAASTAVALGVHARRVRHLDDKEWTIQAVREVVQAYGPEVALYHSGGRGSTFQINVWLSTLASLNRRPVIIIREAEHLTKIARTSVPILCIPDTVTLLSFDLPTLKVALYVSNVGKNIHLQQIDNVKHVFIGHGDSDKRSSARPVSRVYDEVWVAGPAGRERYRRASVGVRDSQIVEVGRPQLIDITRRPAQPADRIFTVLYAPTWEGWSSDMHMTSIYVMGKEIIEKLLSVHAPVRVIYKPHPLTGQRSTAVKHAHLEIVERLQSASFARGPEVITATEDPNRATNPALRVADIERQMQDFHGVIGSRDLAHHSSQHQSPDERYADLELLEAEWRRAYWAARASSHVTVMGPNPHLYSCFEQADMLISDISSVVSDFVATEKPFVVTNPEGIDEWQFRADYAAAAGAYLLGQECAELPDILAAVRTESTDDLAERRRSTKLHLLGPDEPNAVVRFNQALDDLIERESVTHGERLQGSRVDIVPSSAAAPA